MSDPEVFTIPAHNYERVIKEIEKLNRRAQKLNFPCMELEVVKQYDIPHPKYVKLADAGHISKESIPMVTMRDIVVNGDAVKIEGFDLMGTLDHYSIPGKCIVKTVPGQSVPSEFHNHDATCDHCNKKRYRTETFVLREDGTDNYTVVGRQCVRDFIGYDVSALMRYLQRWRDLTASFSDEEDDRWWGGRYVPQYNKEEVLASTFGAIRVRGWKAKSACDEGETPTSVYVANLFEPPVFSRGQEREKADWYAFVQDVQSSHKEDLVEAGEAIEWLKQQPDNNEYMHNLHVLNECESIPSNMFGYWCSLAAAYQRAMNTLKVQQAARQAQKNEWIGDPKDRLELEVEVVTITAIDGAYGVVNIHRMLDSEGRTLVWFANTDSPEMDAGHKYVIRATVKKHDEYKDWKQTVVSRCQRLTTLS